MCYVVLIDTCNSFYSLSACLNPHIIYSYFFCGNCCVLGEKLTGRILEIAWLSTFSLSLNFVFVLQIIQPFKYSEHFFKFCYKWKFIHSAHMSWVSSVVSALFQAPKAQWECGVHLFFCHGACVLVGETDSKPVHKSTHARSQRVKTGAW